jgi:lincosamide nucleotidyltransferase B/F
MTGSPSTHGEMGEQLALIARLRELCRGDERVVAALLYGSFATGEADAFSDVEAALYFDPAVLPGLDLAGWIGQLAPVAAFFRDDFGHYTAIFDNLLRGEFHFEPAGRMAGIAGWQGNAWFPSAEAAILIDRTGELARRLAPMIGPPPERDTPAIAERLILNFANVALFGSYTLERGELARSLELLSLSHRYLEQMARLVEGATQHWPTPSRSLEQDISPEAYMRLVACSARLEREELHAAYREAWRWGSEMADVLARRHSLRLPVTLFTRIGERVRSVTGARGHQKEHHAI